MEEISLERPVEARIEVMTGACYEGARTTDGVPIDTRQKYTQYLKATGLAPSSDFSASYVEKAREGVRREQSAERRETIGRTIHQLENRKRR